jgi:SAM-dependent methyltransferase
MEKDRIKKVVRDKYGSIAKTQGSCCGPTNSCCGPLKTADDVSKKIGYSDAELNTLPGEANLGLGCGNPTALASLSEGDAVLDLGSGAGIDCFLAARKVGKTGTVVGIDMTSEMVDKARQNATLDGYENVEFRLGEIENLPAGDSSFDVVISNCVINLSPDKKKVFEEAYRVLKPGGRLLVSDIVLLKALPETIKSSVEAYTGCIAGAMLKDEYLDQISSVGFMDIEVVELKPLPMEYILSSEVAREAAGSLGLSPGEISDLGVSVASVYVRGERPRE